MENYFLSSKNRESSVGSISEPTFYLPKPLDSTNGFNVKVINVNIPNTYKQINSLTPNTLTYTLTRTAIANLTSTITIPSGTYNVLSLLNVIKTLLISDILLNRAITITTFNFTYSSDTFYATFGFLSEAVTTTITWNNTKLNKMLGFIGAISFDNTTTTTSSQSVDMNPVHNFYLKCVDFSLASNDNFNSYVNNSDIVSKIWINALPGGYINYYGRDILISKANSLSKLTFSLTDSDYNIITLELDWTIAISLEPIILTQKEINLPIVDYVNVQRKEERKEEKKEDPINDKLRKYLENVSYNVKL